MPAELMSYKSIHIYITSVFYFTGIFIISLTQDKKNQVNVKSSIMEHVKTISSFIKQSLE